MKTPKCKYCHKLGHYESSCWKKAWDYRLNRGKMRSKASNSRSKVGLGSKAGKLSSSEQNERRKLIKELDSVTSLVVRLDACDGKGMITCYTCGVRIPWKQAHCCHFWKRRRFNTRWDLENLRAGCPRCNVTLNGNYEVYLPKLRKELGEEKYWELSRRAHSTQKVTTLEMRELLDSRTQELKTIIGTRKKRGWKI